MFLPPKMISFHCKNESQVFKNQKTLGPLSYSHPLVPSDHRLENTGLLVTEDFHSNGRFIITNEKA